MGRLSWIIQVGPNTIICILTRERGTQESERRRRGNGNKGLSQRERWEEATLLALKMDKGAASQGCRRPLEAAEGKTTTDSSLESPEGTQPCQRVGFSSVKSVLDFRPLEL